MASVTLTNLQKTFVDTQTKPAREVKAVDNLDLKINDGEFLVLVGPSGCGKTTTMRMVAGLEEATGGEIRIGERVVNDVPPRDRNIAMVFQNYALYPHMSVYENMAFGLKLRMMPPFFERLTNASKTREVKAEIDRRIKEAAEILGITHLLDRKPKALSGGQRQRVALGRAIVREPQVFLMDEPLSNLDAKLRVQTRAELIQLHRRLGITTIYVTHDQAEAMTMGQRIAVMKDGLLQQCDTPLTLYHKPVNMFVAGFLGTPSMNFIKNARLRLENGVPIVDAGEFSVTLPAAHAERLAAYNGKSIVIGIRPENIADKSLLSGAAAETNVVRMQVEVIEPMGARSTLLLSLGAQTLVAEVDPETRAKEGAPLDVVLDTSRVHLFDPTTEDAIL